MSRMSMREFKELVAQTMQSLPPEILPHLTNIVVDVAREPDEDFLRERADFTEEEIEEGASLLGFFEPLGPLNTEALDLADQPHRLWIFKNPHEDEFPDPKRLRIEVRKTVIHELAHHFGWTDRDLQRFDNNPDPFA